MISVHYVFFADELRSEGRIVDELWYSTVWSYFVSVCYQVDTSEFRWQRTEDGVQTNVQPPSPWRKTYPWSSKLGQLQKEKEANGWLLLNYMFCFRDITDIFYFYLQDTTCENYKNIEFFPNKFHDYLLSPEVGFSHSYPLGIPRHLSKGFRRPIQVSCFNSTLLYSVFLCSLFSSYT